MIVFCDNENITFLLCRLFILKIAKPLAHLTDEETGPKRSLLIRQCLKADAKFTLESRIAASKSRHLDQDICEGLEWNANCVHQHFQVETVRSFHLIFPKEFCDIKNSSRASHRKTHGFLHQTNLISNRVLLFTGNDTSLL